jgi:hypothetical protein
MTENKRIVMDLLLLDGVANGIIRLMLRNREGIAFKIPRNYANQLSQKLPEIGCETCRDKSCVYILFGSNTSGHVMAYIGETDDITNRLINHYSGKLFWDTAIVFCRNDNDFGKDSIRYIETYLIEFANRIGRYRIENSTKNQYPHINESNRIVAEDFIESVKILAGTLGYPIFEARQIISEATAIAEDLPVFVITRGGAIEAKGQPTSGGFVVFKDSQVYPVMTRSIPKPIKYARKRLIRRGVIVENRFVKDFVFSSSSTAASVIWGGSMSGGTTWGIPLPDGSYKTLKLYFEEQKKEKETD